MELTKTKLNNILKKYRIKLEQHNKEWEELCRKKCKHEEIGDKIVMTTPSIYDHERHNCKGAILFKNLMKEFEGYEVFPKKEKLNVKELFCECAESSWESEFDIKNCGNCGRKIRKTTSKKELTKTKPISKKETIQKSC